MTAIVTKHEEQIPLLVKSDPRVLECIVGLLGSKNPVLFREAN